MTATKKVAIVAPSPVPYTVGGAEKLWWGLLDAFKQHTDYEVELIKVPSPERNFREIIDSYYYFSKLDLNHFDLVISTKYPAWMTWHENHWVYLQHRLRGLYDTYPADMPLEPFAGEGEAWPDELARLRELLVLQPHVDHRDELFSVVGNLKAELPALQWDSWFALPSPLARKVTRWLDDSALAPGMIKKYMAISQTVAKREGYFPRDVPVQVIHHPSDLPPALSSASRYLFTVSRLDAPKRLDLLIRAMRASSADVQLLIAGSGPQRSELEQLIGDDERILLLGRVNDAQLRRYYGGALCVPFLPMDEDYGLITVEAMQAGKPVLTCEDTGGVTELVETGRTGWIVPATEAALASAIDDIAASPENAIAMGKACRQRVAKINWQDTLAAILDEVDCLDAYGFAQRGKPNHILVPLTFGVYPPRSGGQSRVYHLYRRLARYVPVTLLTQCGAEEQGMDGEIAPGLRELRIPRSLKHQQGERAAEKTIRASISDLYAIEHTGDTPAYLEALRELGRKSELVIASHPYLYRALRSVYRGPVYYEAHNVEYDMKRDILKDAATAGPWLELIETTEGDCARDAIGLSACSSEDRQRLHDLYGVPLENIAIVPNGVAADEIPDMPVEVRQRVARRLGGSQGAPAAVFVGSWHGPNIEAVRWIIQSLAPATPGVNYWVLGSVCNYWKNLRNKSLPANVILLGQLDESDKNAVLSCAQIALNPVTTGSGSNLKMAEYIVAGLSVVSTQFGCRGLNIEGLPAVRVVELDEFSSQIEDLALNTPAKPLPTGEFNGKRALIEAFDWDRIADGYFTHLVSVFGQLVTDRANGE